jgi:hypothetical protein
VRLVPFTGEALGLGELVEGHPAFNSVATFDRVLSRLTGPS